ncbi:hypothetical protein I2485_03175 [Nesterenkonia sp. E16_7]|uniref:hypothetical protein n=1 Tax=unclassified Nesterenkonia TaxID=2629769 RepID=UPI001A9165A6|nr:MULTISPECIES: hypothetical protein [unclassified Nesterenkonia]MBO0594204.1 hypothetical protein [Nesterenkonia sp. E16_10]MBO0597650.1 hypothetical protein [Nesterenkonia sp. E16_7]
MKYIPVAASALLAATALALASWAGTLAMTLVVCGLSILIALGWPQLMGVAARRSLSAVIACAGVIAALGAGIVDTADELFFWSSVALAFGVMSVFLIQVLRGTGRPHRLESTIGACAGVLIATTGAGWVAGLRYPVELADATGDGAPGGLLAVRGLLPLEDTTLLAVTGASGELAVVTLAAGTLIIATLLAAIPLPNAWAMLLVVLGSVGAAIGMTLAWGELTLLFAGTLGLVAGLLLASFRRFLLAQGPPQGILSGIAVGTAPIAAMGALTYFTERLLLV